MRLKVLEIQGYKSFANKSVFNFDNGIIAIVGPNGSGKSNVADAIRWVLGEQSFSNLRGQRTSDMIFAGSASRARMGMAQVSIILDNSDGTLPLDYNEVTISRRAFRSGENEYLINNNKVRLKDVSELLARGGLSRQTYTVIGQGTIDRALSLRAEERRQLFEEAAGITYHRQRRAETLRRLDETHNNLIRINDIVKEIEPRLKRLERQASKVVEHNKIRLHLDSLLKVWYGYQWGQKQQSLHRARVRETIAKERLDEDRQNLSLLETEIKDLRQSQVELRGKLGSWHAESSKIHSQAERIQRELAVGEERARQLAAQREEFLTEIQILEEQIKLQQEQVSEAQQRLNETNQAYQQAKNAYNQAKKDLDAHQQQREILRHQHQQALKERQKAANAIIDRQLRLEQLAEQNKELLAQKETQQGQILALQEQAQSLKAALKTVEATLKELQDQITRLIEQQTKTIERREALEAEAQTLSAQQSETEKTLASLIARQDLLAKLRADMSGYHQGVKEVLQSSSLKGIKGTMAQLVQVPAKYETAFEVAIGGHLQDVVVDSWKNAENAIEHLKKHQAGRATFLPLDNLRPPKAISVPKVDGIIGLATDLADYDSEIGPAVDSILNRTLIAKNLASARKAFNALKGGFQIVTLSGEIVRSGGSVSGGKIKSNQQHGSMLAREREWRELPEQIENANQQLTALQKSLNDNKAEQNKLGEALHNLRQQIQTTQHSINSQNQQAGQHKSDLGNVSKQTTWYQDQINQTEQKLTANESSKTEMEADIERFTAIQEKNAQLVGELESKLAVFSLEALQTALNQAQIEVRLIKDKAENQSELLKTHKNSLNQTQAQLNSRQGRISHLAQQRESLLSRLETQEKEHTALVEAVKLITDKIEPSEAHLKSLETAQAKKEQAESAQREALRRQEAEYNRLTLELARRQDEMDALHKQIEDDFGLVQLELSDDQIGQPVLPLESMITQLPTIEELPDGIEEDIRHLRVQMRQLGYINPGAPDEFEELRDRFEFLSHQMTDLEQASEDLKAIIDELDKIMQEAFINTFTAVAKEFQNYFKILFNGGEAQLILTDVEDITKTGVDIVARPPGKRPQSLELLSGGERSLTAQALIFALLKTSPTPYCIFDEVDAMLDEANVDRFRQALMALGKDIQFVVITHNRKTIEIADAIYGISMSDDAVSRMVSLKLEDIPENGLNG